MTYNDLVNRWSLIGGLFEKNYAQLRCMSVLQSRTGSLSSEAEMLVLLLTVVSSSITTKFTKILISSIL